MGKFDGIMICSDLDGTLLNEDSVVPQNNVDAIEYFKSEGGVFTFVTGRMPWFVREIYDVAHPNAPIGCINGGGVYDFATDTYLWTRELSRDVLELIEYAMAEVEGIGVQINTFDTVYFCAENSAMEGFRRITGVPNCQTTCRSVDQPFAKILFGDEREAAIERLAELLPKHPKAGAFDFVRSHSTLYEILPRGIHKGILLPKIAEYKGIDMRHTIAVGDYNNDIGMLRTAAIGIAVQNALPEVKAVADHVTASNEEGAIARIIEDLDRGVLAFS